MLKKKQILFQLFIFLWSSCVVPFIDATRVVVICYPSISHTKVLYPTARELVRYGHNVSIVIPEMFAQNPNLQLDGINKLVYTSFNSTISQKNEKGHAQLVNGEMSFSYIFDILDLILKDESLFEKLKKEQFEYAIVDGSAMSNLLAIIPYRLSIPFAKVGSSFDMWNRGIFFLPSVTPHKLTYFSDRMTFMERLLNTAITIGMQVFDIFSPSNAVLTYAPEKTYISVTHLTSLTTMWIIDEDILDYSKPTMPNSKIVGGLTIQRPQPLPTDIKHFLEQSDNGVIYMAWGTNGHNLSDEHDRLFRKVFESLQYGIIWVRKTDFNDTNVLAKPWFPQNDVLAHPKTKLFISHCGTNSQYEALYHVVPILCIPMLGDQFYNSVRGTTKGFGKRLSIHYLTFSDVKRDIEDLIMNVVYKEKIKQASDILKSRKQMPYEEAAYWLNHVIKHGGDHLRSSGLDMPWYKFLLVDILLVYAIFVYVVFKCCIILVKLCANKISKIKQD